MFAIAYISFIVAAFMSGIQDGLIALGVMTMITSFILFGITFNNDNI